MLNITFGQSKYYVDGFEREHQARPPPKTAKRNMAGVAPLGYLNNSKTKSIDLDNEKSALVRKCFELYATGDNTLKNIKQFLADTGLDSYKGNVLLNSNVSSECSKILFTMESFPLQRRALRRKPRANYFQETF